MWLPLQNLDEIDLATDEGNSRNETWDWTKGEIGVALQSSLWVRIEFVAQ